MISFNLRTLQTFVPEYSHGYLIKQLFTKDRTFEETIITRHNWVMDRIIVKPADLCTEMLR